jgi:hypothetical protein
MTYTYAVCPYDGTPLGSIWDQVCRNPTVPHNLGIPIKYQKYAVYSYTQNVAACPNCRTPYLYSNLPYELRAQFNRERLAAGCFIATAAMESHLHPHVQSLRNFRDNFLLKSSHKDSFENLLNFYYKLSPPIARAMSKHKTLKVFLRYSVVYPVVFGIKMILPIFNVVLGIEGDAMRRQK